MIAGAPSSTVEVLLSTHNGEQYVATQLASILNQSYGDFRVVVRDDGSTDRTVEVVRTIAGDDPRVRVLEGPRLGWGGSFMALLATSGQGRWFAFADQDDVWLPDKLSRGIAALEPHDERPALYASAMLHVSRELRRLSPTPLPRRTSFANALVQNILPGCTMVINRAARDLCLESVPHIPAHDWWLYLVISAFGTVIFDDAITVLHRVHTANATPTHWLHRLAAHVKLPPERRLSALDAAFYDTYGDRLSSEQRVMIEELLALRGVSWLSRARYAWRSPLFRQRAVDDAILRVLLTLGRF